MKKIIYLAAVILAVSLLLCSCIYEPTVNENVGAADTPGEEDNNGVTDKEEAPSVPEVEDEDFIWNKDSEIYVISSKEESANEKYSTIYGTVLTEIYTSLSYLKGNVLIRSDSDAPHPHEIVVGRTEREISRTAYSYIENLSLADDEVCFLIYSDGSSLALAYTNADESVAIKAMGEYVDSNMIKEELTLEEGVVHFSIYSMNEIYQQRDDALVEKAWSDYRENVYRSMAKTMSAANAEKYADDLVKELKALHGMYTDDLVDWFAGLYEPYICICEGECKKTRYCGGAGFYYSNSARDNKSLVKNGKTYLLLPDAETTAQVLGFISHSGMIRQQGGNYFTAFPEGEPERIVRFIKALQDESSGYFYHPQWLSMLGTADFWDSRQSRDLNYSLSVLNAFGALPTYDTPTGVEGDGILYDGTNVNRVSTVSHLTLPINYGYSRSVAMLVSSSAHPHLESLESFNKYLSTLNLAGNSYYVGNELASLAPQIIARDKEIGTSENPRPLATRLDEWLRENQDPETGYWHKYSSGSAYYPINGLLKIAALYNTLGLPFPNPLAAARSAFSVIDSDEKIDHVCDLYNTWFAVSCITGNLRKYSKNADLAAQIIDEVRADAVYAVKVTAEKMKAHQKPDGSFSYFEDRSSATSQNAPVAIPDTNEGDVNATVIFTYGILDYMYDTLGFGSYAPILTDCDRKAFVQILEAKIEACEYRNKE